MPWARPSFVGLLAAVVVTASLARAIGRFAPRALAHVRRVPLALVALAAGGLGACVGAASLGTLVLLSPWLLHGRAYVVAGASFGLAYWTLLMVPFLSVRLGRAPRSLLSVTQVGAGLVAGAYAVWNASALG